MRTFWRYSRTPGTIDSQDQIVADSLKGRTPCVVVPAFSALALQDAPTNALTISSNSTEFYRY